jgi:LuxR family maltose regulon positive regulatory protein
MTERKGDAEPTTVIGGRKLLRRARMDALLDRALTRPLTLVVAGAGYGKSTAVYSYLREGPARTARTVWVQLSEKDNMPSHFWESISQAVASLNTRLAAELRAVGFPTTEDARQHIKGLAGNEIGTRHSYVLVLDDLHLITNEDVLAHIVWVAHAAQGMLSVIALSRQGVLPQTSELLKNDQLSRIGETELSFTKDELARYFELMGIPISSELLTSVLNETEGWPLAVSFTAHLLEKHSSHDHASIHTALKGSFSAMIDDELFSAIPHYLQHFLVRFSLIKHLSPRLIQEFPGGQDALDALTVHSSLIRFDHYTQVYRFHHLLQQYLKDKQDMLTEGERFETYAKAARWCDENGYRLDALTYYHAMSDYAAIIRVAYTFPLVMPCDVASELLEIIEQTPRGILKRSATLAILHTRLLMTVGRVEGARVKLRGYIEGFEQQPPCANTSRALLGLHNNTGFAKMLTCAETHDFSFFEDFERGFEYFDSVGELPDGGFMVYSLGPYALRLGDLDAGEPERFIEAVSRAAPRAAATIKGCMFGLDELTRAEYAFYQGRAVDARHHTLRCIGMARECGQYEIEARALFLLLRVYLQAGKFDLITEALAQLEELTNQKNFANRTVLYEIITSWFYAMIGEFDRVEAWLKSDLWSSSEHAIFDGINDVVKVKYYLVNKNYKTLLSFIDSRSARFGILRFGLGRIGLWATRAVCLMHLGDKAAALDMLQQAYELARPCGIDMPFIELGNSMRSLARMALKEAAAVDADGGGAATKAARGTKAQAAGTANASAEARGAKAQATAEAKLGIPVAWLETIQSKAATYAKRLAHVRSCYLSAHNPEAHVPLTSKELEVLEDLSQGLSRTEISLAHGISINTVKTMLPLIYQKLGAEGAMDAIRKATAKKLL